MRKKRTFFLLIVVFCVFISLSFLSYKKKIKSWHKKKQIQNYLLSHKTSEVALETPLSWPFQLNKIPFSDEEGFIKKVQTISIEEIDRPYNASLLKKEDGYYLFFRFDTRHEKKIGLIELDKNFSRVSKKYKELDTKSTTSEDARVLRYKDQICLVYNVHDEKTQFRSMRLGKLKKNGDSFESIFPLNIQKSRHEKNWSPFVYENSLFFEYYINPHTILEVPDLKGEENLKTAYTTFITDLKWPEIWGELRGGTPPQKIGDQYLGFFHSMFKNEEKHLWYVMGAYTFEAKPPFQLTAISPYPILFKGIYESPLRKKTHCVFPCGFVLENIGGKDFIHVSLGENDTTIKIITFDQELLLKSLKKI